MEIITRKLDAQPAPNDEIIRVAADRASLARRRWRAIAADGREFGFDVDAPLADGDAVYRDGSKCYVIAQAAEPVIETALPPDPSVAARLAWQIGNLHIPIEAGAVTIRTPDDVAVRQLLDREGVPYVAREAVFRPIAAAAGHHHH